MKTQILNTLAGLSADESKSIANARPLRHAATPLSASTDSSIDQLEDELLAEQVLHPPVLLQVLKPVDWDTFVAAWDWMHEDEVLAGVAGK